MAGFVHQTISCQKLKKEKCLKIEHISKVKVLLPLLK